MQGWTLTGGRVQRLLLVAGLFLVSALVAFALVYRHGDGNRVEVQAGDDGNQPEVGPHEGASPEGSANEELDGWVAVYTGLDEPMLGWALGPEPDA